MPFSPCPSKDSIPFYYFLTLDIIGGISIPMNLMTFWLVLFKSPKMKGYKYCLCYLQGVSIASELLMAVISPSYYFFPMVAGFNPGTEAISAHFRITLFMFIFPFELPSILLCFIVRNRAAEVIGNNQRRKISVKNVALFLAHLFPFFVGYGMWKSGWTYQQKYDYLKNYWPECIEWMFYNNFVAYDYKVNVWLAIVGLGALSLVYFTYFAYLGLSTMIVLEKHKRSMSTQTFIMHKTALFSLSMQILVPGVLLITPLGICLFVVITEAVELQPLATNSMFLIASHSTCSCTVLITCNANYKKILKQKAIKILSKIWSGFAAKSSVQPGNSLVVIRSAGPFSTT